MRISGNGSFSYMENKIRFIQCNSAVVSNSKEKKRQLIDINTFAQIAMESELPTIVLAHNNFEDIHEEQQKQIQGIIRTSKIKAYFAGIDIYSKLNDK